MISLSILFRFCHYTSTCLKGEIFLLCMYTGTLFFVYIDAGYNVKKCIVKKKRLDKNLKNRNFLSYYWFFRNRWLYHLKLVIRCYL